MPSKDVYLFDSFNNPLQVPGLHVDLCEVATGTLLDAKLSVNLKTPNNDHGVRLNFPPCTGPLDIYFADPNYRYPGNTVRNLNGQLPDRLDIDLLQVPVIPSPLG